MIHRVAPPQNRCDDGLKIQKKMINNKPDLKEYQRELEKNYHTFLTHMRPLFGQTSQQAAAASAAKGGSPRCVSAPLLRLFAQFSGL